MDVSMDPESAEEVETGGQRLTPLRPVDNPATADHAFHESGGRSFSQLYHRSLTPAETLPSQWYRDDRIHQLERRAIFSKSWILVTHVSRFAKEGDYVAFEIANFPLHITYVALSGKPPLYVCFNRMCVVIEGFRLCPSYLVALQLSDGRLVRSTHTSFPSFDPSKYSLFKIHTHVMGSGFIFVNLAVQDPPPFRGWFGDLENEWDSFRPDEYEYAYSWTYVLWYETDRESVLKPIRINGAYNWKTWMECVHCHTSHPGYAASLDLSTYAVETRTRYAVHITALKPGGEEAASTSTGGAEKEGAPSFAYVFPSNAVTVTNVLWYMMRVVLTEKQPISATQTRMEYDVFKHKSISLERLRAYMQFYEKVEDEDFHLVTATQKSLNTGIYRRGSLHPTKENGVIYYQRLVRTAVEDHLAEEQRLGHEWNPAQPLSQGGGRGDTRFPETDAVCRGRMCDGEYTLSGRARSRKGGGTQDEPVPVPSCKGGFRVAVATEADVVGHAGSVGAQKGLSARVLHFAVLPPGNVNVKIRVGLRIWPNGRMEHEFEARTEVLTWGPDGQPSRPLPACAVRPSAAISPAPQTLLRALRPADRDWLNDW
ncbi:hypothetical protein CALCODRAFT_506746 [Calocera cornea HHB12733]|uniref:Choline monooxygenase, chloroplastic n=1 Tax=Calocera cornea HHB12733 TaxID=1353952 RepID=A0A165IJV9_9BASI|nr:hypothetical protein CALCODRAFT_506746 [Calocera cornea HHB12733]